MEDDDTRTELSFLRLGIARLFSENGRQSNLQFVARVLLRYGKQHG